MSADQRTSTIEPATRDSAQQSAERTRDSLIRELATVDGSHFVPRHLRAVDCGERHARYSPCAARGETGAGIQTRTGSRVSAEANETGRQSSSDAEGEVPGTKGQPMSDTSEEDILTIRIAAARTEEQAAAVRLETAYLEQEATKRTIAMAEKVAQSMYEQQMGVRS